MKKKLSLLALATLVAVGGFTVTQVSAANIDVASGESIQEAIDGAAPGDVITVAAGNYAGPITINKPLTLRGAQTGVDARDRSGIETVLNVSGSNPVITIDSADVTVSGFTIDGSTGVNPTGISVTPGARENVTVSHNIITNHRGGFSAGTGTDLSNLAVTHNAFVLNNNTAVPGSNALYLGNITADGVTITNNSFVDTAAATGSSNAVQVVAPAAGDITGVTISDNSSSNDGSFVFLINVHNVTISSNTVADLAGHGVLVGDGVGELVVSNNTFTDSASGVRLNGESLGNVEITDNTISGMSTAGVSVGSTTTAESVVVQGNSLTGNTVGVLNESDVAVDANRNWWGCEAGPGAAGCDTIDGVVLASEWYVSDAMTTTNLDTDESVVPGVPNTSQATSVIGYLIATLAVVVALAVVAIVVYRRRSTNS